MGGLSVGHAAHGAQHSCSAPPVSECNCSYELSLTVSERCVTCPSMPKEKAKKVRVACGRRFFSSPSQASEDPYQQALKLREQKLKVQEAKRQECVVFFLFPAHVD